MNVQHIKLNIIPGGVLPVVHVSQYDHNAGGLVFDIYNGGEVYELPEGTTASIEGTKPDEYGFLYPAADVSGHSVTIDVMEQMTVVPGKVICELRLAHQQDNVGTINFILAVEPAGLSDDTEVSETDIPLLREAIEAGQQALQSAEQAELSADRAEDEADRAEAAADSLTAIRTTVPAETVEVGDAKAAALQQFRADFEPRQDLHGYERPWAGGAGKNLIDDTIRISNSAETSVTVGQNVGYNTPSVAMKAGTYTFSAVYRNGATSRGYMKKTGDTSSTMLWDVGSNHATFTLAEDTTCSFWLYNAAGITSADVNAQIEAGTEATEYTPYANICPIEGTTGPITVTRAGKNLIDDSQRITNSSRTTLTLGQTVGYGTPTVFMKAGTYTFSVIFASGVTGAGYVKVGSASPVRIWDIGARQGTITIESDSLCSFYVYNGNNPFASVDSVISAQVELGDTATTYESYVTRDEYAITIPSEPGTVYGGTLTVNSDGSGQIAIDRALVTYDGTENWTAASGAHPSYRAPRGVIPASAKGLLSNLMTLTDTQYAAPGYGYVGTTNLVCYLDSASTDNLAAWKAYLAAHPMQVVYHLTTPTAYPLTGAQVVQMLQGSNTIWMDVDGQIQITYITASQLSGIVEELDELQADVAEIQPAVADLQTNAVKKSDIVQTGTVTTAGQYVVDARQLNPDLTGTIAKRITDLETGAASAVKTADITRATNITATGTKVVDAYELNASKTGTLARKISEAATAASAAQTTANTANTAAGNANTALGGFSFGFTADNKPGYKQPGADTVVPFSDGSLEDLTTTDFPITFNGAGTFTRTVPGTIIAAGTVGFTANVDYITAETRSGWPSVSFSDDTLTVVVLHPFGVTVTAMVRVWYIPA